MTQPRLHYVRPPDYPSVPLPDLRNLHAIAPCDAPEGLNPSHAPTDCGVLWRAQCIVEEMRNGRTLPHSFALSCINDGYILAMRQEFGIAATIQDYSHSGPCDAHWQLVGLAQTLIRCGVAPHTVKDALTACISDH